MPSIRNAQRLVDRVRQLGAGSERIKVLLNRVSDQHLIAPKQIETALGYGIHHTFSSDYRTVSTALNSGVPLTLTNNSEIASQFDSFTRQLVGMAASGAAARRSRKPSASAFSSASSKEPVNHERSCFHRSVGRHRRRARRRVPNAPRPSTSS